MSKLISLSIDVTKLDKSRYYHGKNGAKYASLDVWINDEEDQYGKNVSVNESLSKEERAAKMKKNYVGNGKTILGFDEPSTATHSSPPAVEDDGEDCPF